MFTALALALAVPSVASPPAADPRLTRMATLFDELCLHAFPDDGTLDAAMAAKNARPLTDAQARVTLVGDPGRGWEISGGGGRILIFLELPPFHACSVRFPMPSAAPDDAAYRTVVDAYEAHNPGFATGPGYDADRGDIHIHATMEARRLPDGRTETLMMFDQWVIDPARRARGETGIMRRFVHQIVAPH